MDYKYAGTPVLFMTTNNGSPLPQWTYKNTFNPYTQASSQNTAQRMGQFSRAQKGQFP
jgi:hypothetical protein